MIELNKIDLENKKEIYNERSKKYYRDHKEHCKKCHKQWLENNPEYRIEYHKGYRKKNKEKLLMQGKKWREGNPEYNKIWYQNNKKERTEQIKQWYQNNKEKMSTYKKEYQREWNKTEKGKIADQRHQFKRRTKMGEIINTLTLQEWLNILEEYNYRCAYCGIEFEVENLPTKDHVISIDKGGNNTKENIVPACRSCNSKKNNKAFAEEKE